MADKDKNRKLDQEPGEGEKDEKEEILGLWRNMSEKMDKLLEALKPAESGKVENVPAPPPAPEPKPEPQPEPKRKGFLDWLW